MINPDIIKERLQEIDENLKILAKLKKVSKEKFKSDPEIFREPLKIRITAIPA